MAARKLNTKQLDALKSAINYRISIFPRGEVIQKLESADKAYHLAKIENTQDNSDGTRVTDGVDSANKSNPQQDYSRFQELQNALVREIAETFGANYITTFAGEISLFSMTSSEDRKEEAAKFNVVMSDQAKRTKWMINVHKVLKDVAKYNIALADVHWGHITYNSLERVNLDSDTNTGSNVKVQSNQWGGNFIERWDPYNCMWDISVAPEELSSKGEWAAHVEVFTQVRLAQLINNLENDTDTEVYLTPQDASDPKSFTVYGVQGAAINNSIDSNNAGDYNHYTPIVSNYGGDKSSIESSSMNWNRHLGRAESRSKAAADSNVKASSYLVTKCYLRIVPSSYGMQEKGVPDLPEIWEVRVLEGKHILSTKRLTNVHGMLPTEMAVTDSDSLGYNSTGPTQIAIPYSKLAKQLQDRVLAGADRAIGDRALFDERYVDKDEVNSKVPEAKIPFKKSLGNKQVTDVYYSIPYDNNATRDLYSDKQAVETSGRQAAGLNLPQQGQFQPGNKTLFEYQDIMSNAGDKTYTRSLFLEHTFFHNLKTKIKTNIIQYQQEATLFDPSTRQEIEIKPAELFAASVDFKLIDSLMPSEYVMSPNVQQALFTLLAQNPEAFVDYDTADMVAHIVSQSLGIDMEQYKRAQEGNGQAN